MSRAMRLGLALRRVSDQFIPQLVGAPPANWSYGANLRDRGGGKSRAVALSFVSTTLAMTTTLSAMTWSYDLPMLYTSDRFPERNPSALWIPFKSTWKHSMIL